MRGNKRICSALASQCCKIKTVPFAMGSLIESLSELSKCLAELKKMESDKKKKRSYSREKKNQGAIESGVDRFYRT